MRTSTVFASAVAIFAASTGTAHAQGFTLNRFEPSERGSSWFTQESLDLRGHVRPAFGIIADYQNRPLAIYDANGDVRTRIVGNQFTAHIGASFVFFDRLRLAVSAPVVLVNDGNSGTYGGSTLQAPSSSTSFGDLRFGADVRLLGAHDGPFTLAAGAQLWVPTGDTANYTSDGSVRVGPRLLAAGEISSFVYAARLGVLIRDPDASTFATSPIGNELTYGASAGLRVDGRRLTVGPELYGSTNLADAAFKTRTSPLELLLGGHYAFDGGFRAGLGVGTGLTRGYGSPLFRALASLEWSPDIIDDADGDGVADKDDACPKVVGLRSADPQKNGCPAEPAAPPPAPELDTDGDGILDKNDACPKEPGKASADPAKNGCPERDSDGDGVFDEVDACPTVAGLKTDDPKTNGCPDPDRDKDGVPNVTDACPDEPGKADADPKRNGCPKAFVQAGQIKILDQVKFKTGSAQILPGKDSEEVLQAVLKVLNEHAEIKKLRVEGHTDDRGAAAMNRKLSSQRAASVVTWLTKHGIDASRLASAGFGPDKPIDTNATDAGRQNNRRVEFHIEDSGTTTK